MGGGSGQSAGGNIPSIAAEQGSGFFLSPGRSVYSTYVVMDPSGVGAQGYIDPVTKAPYNHSRPWNSNEWDPVSNKFYKEYMEHHFPNRIVNNYYNSTEIRIKFYRMRWS